MSKTAHDASAKGNSHGADAMETAPPAASSTASLGSDGLATAATVGVVAVGALIFEAALIPGLVLGVAAALVPRYLPDIGSALNPLFRSTVRGAYKLGQKSREALAEAQEHFHDIAAEVDAEHDAKGKAKDATAGADGRSGQVAA